MDAVEADIAACAASHRRLEQLLAGLSDEAARAPSRLPGWSVGHVLTHVARNADSVVRRVEGIARGEVVTQYEDGRDGRAADIEAGAGRSAAELVADVASSNAACEAALAGVPAAAWDGATVEIGGVSRPANGLPFSRWREVEVHMVDLGLGYEPSDWPEALVDRWLPRLVGGLAERSEPSQLMAWALGRAPAPALRPWG